MNEYKRDIYIPLTLPLTEQHPAEPNKRTDVRANKQANKLHFYEPI